MMATGGEPDVGKIKPLIFSEGPVGEYQALGEFIGDVYSIGTELKARE